MAQHAQPGRVRWLAAKVSRIRNATISPEMNVSPATTHSAPLKPRRSAVTPAITAPIAYPRSRQKRYTPDRRRAPRWRRDVADASEKRGIDHRGANTQARRHPPRTEKCVGRCNDGDAGRLRPHTSCDQPLPSDTVRERARRQLPETPRGRVDGCERRCSLQAHARSRKEQWKEAPCHAVVEVVDEPRLADAGEIAISASWCARRFHPTFERRPVRCGDATPRSTCGWVSRTRSRDRLKPNITNSTPR